MTTLYGSETKKAIKNFPFSAPVMQKEFIMALVEIKKAAAEANFASGNMDEKMKNAIVKACYAVLSGKHDDQFPLTYLQGGAGTSVNMNVNEVIANISHVHPLDDVNRSQSTNDVCPSALRIVSYRLTIQLIEVLKSLEDSFIKKSNEFSDVKKLARTHLQDAVPTTLGAEFGAYGAILNTDIARVKHAAESLRKLNLGGTAIGNSVNASEKYIEEIYKHFPDFQKADNFMAATSSQSDFLALSQAITALSADMSKIAGDFRLMSSGPKGGFGEIILPEMQAGSTIMPGKVNPVIPESVNQLYFNISGNNLTIEHCVQAAQLELGVMFPTLAYKLLQTLILTREVMEQFNISCISGIKANKERCLELLEKSPANSAELGAKMGYEKAADIVKKSLI